jgi:hypothetical protein
MIASTSAAVNLSSSALICASSSAADAAPDRAKQATPITHCTAVAAIPPDWQPEAFQAAERSYLRAFGNWAFRATDLGFFGHAPIASPSSGSREGKAKNLYEQLSADEHRSALPFGQAHIFATHEAASLEEQKNLGRELPADEHIGQAHSFATHEAASSEEQKNVGGELSAERMAKRTVSQLIAALSKYAQNAFAIRICCGVLRMSPAYLGWSLYLRMGRVR